MEDFKAAVGMAMQAKRRRPVGRRHPLQKFGDKHLFCTCRCVDSPARRSCAWAKAGAAKGMAANARPKPPKARLLDTLWGCSPASLTSETSDLLIRFMATPSSLTIAFAD